MVGGDLSLILQRMAGWVSRFNCTLNNPISRSRILDIRRNSDQYRVILHRYDKIKVQLHLNANTAERAGIVLRLLKWSFRASLALNDLLARHICATKVSLLGSGHFTFFAVCSVCGSVILPLNDEWKMVAFTAFALRISSAVSAKSPQLSHKLQSSVFK